MCNLNKNYKLFISIFTLPSDQPYFKSCDLANSDISNYQTLFIVKLNLHHVFSI